MKVSEFIEWLKTQNQDAIVEVNVSVWDDGDHWSKMSIFDLTDNLWDTKRSWDGKEYLQLGGEEW